MATSFRQRLAEPGKLILDGATGTELHRRGVDTGLPLWSANALLNEGHAEILKLIHLDYLRAGADIITTNTFRTHRRTLARAGFGEQAAALTRRAVEIARQAIADFRAERPQASPLVAGSIAPLEDCYSPQLVPPQAECIAEHTDMARHLAEAGVDLLLVETMNTAREASAAAQAALATGLPVIVSFVCGLDGRLLSGESLADATRDIALPGVNAVGANCAPTHTLTTLLSAMRAALPDSMPLIAYGNIGLADDTMGWVNTDAVEPAVYARYAKNWQVKIVGGCCGTTPEHISQLRQTQQ